jgi:hypothetical protein
MEINIIKNMQSAPYMGSRFGQDVEPKGTYVIQKHGTEPAKYPWVDGKAVLENPLFIDVTVETLIKYKYELVKRFKAKGKQLTNKLMDRGYDAIVTRFEDGSTGEIILFPNAKFTLDMKNESKLLIKNILRENINQADKIYFKSGKLSDKARAIVFNITKGDAYTRLVTDMYYVMFKINEKFIEGDILDNKSIKKLQESYQDLLTYNKNVFPIRGLNVNGTDDISNLISSLEKRRGILEMFKKLPSIAYRNMKSDIRKERTHSEMSSYNSDLEYFINFYSMLSNRDDSARAKIDAKMFKKDATLSELINFVEEKENLVGGTKFTKNKIKEIVKEDGYDLEIVYDKGNIMIVEVSGPEGIKKIGCNSLWCFTYGSGFDSAWRSWNNYSTNGLVYVIINFNESPDSPDFMHVLIKPLQDDYDEDEYENPSTLFDMSNEVQYDTNNVISYLMDFEIAKRVMNFDEEVPVPIKEPKKQEPYKDPNQLSLFEIRQKLREGLLVEVSGDKTITAYHGSPNKIMKFVDEFVGGKDANDQEGPGIYFTSSFDNAGHYGEYVHKVKLTPRKLLTTTPSSNKIANLIKKMVLMAPDWEEKAQDWDENPNIGLREFITSTINYNDTEKDVAQQIWYDFYRYDPVDFVRNMVKMGIDGLMIPKEDGMFHYIIYNPSVIKIEN